MTWNKAKKQLCLAIIATLQVMLLRVQRYYEQGDYVRAIRFTRDTAREILVDELSSTLDKLLP